MLQILSDYSFVPLYILALEGIFVIALQMRTLALTKKQRKAAVPKREKMETIKEEVKKGASEIPVVKFEKPEKKEPAKPAEKRSVQAYDQKEMQILQDMMAEFFANP